MLFWDVDPVAIVCAIHVLFVSFSYTRAGEEAEDAAENAQLTIFLSIIRFFCSASLSSRRSFS